MSKSVADKLRGRAAVIQDRLDAIQAAAAERDGENFEFTAEEQTEFEKLLKDRDTVRAQITMAEKADSDRVEDWRRRRGLTDAGELADGKAAKFDDGARFTSNEGKDGPFKNLGEQLQAIANSRRSGKIDERLTKVAAEGALSAVGSDGAFLIQRDFTTRLMDRGREAAVIAPDCTSIPIGENADGLEAPLIDETSRATGSRWGGVQVYRRAEAETVTKTKPKLVKAGLELEDMMGLFRATSGLLRDAPQLGAVVEMAFGSEFAFKFDNEIIRGTGVGEALGILNSPALVTVAKESSQSAAGFIALNAANMYARMPARLLGGAKWYMNSDVFPQLLTMTLGNNAIYLPGGVLATAPFGLLLGRPIVPIEQAETMGTKGDIFFANFSEYIVIEKGGLEAASSIHVYFETDQEVFRWKVRNNGMPAWKSSLAPFKGTAAKSPFVCLATRP